MTDKSGRLKQQQICIFSHLFSPCTTHFPISLCHYLPLPVKNQERNIKKLSKHKHNTSIKHRSFYRIFVAVQQCSGRHRQMQHLLRTQLQHQHAIFKLKFTISNFWPNLSNTLLAYCLHSQSVSWVCIKLNFHRKWPSIIVHAVLIIIPQDKLPVHAQF